MRQFNVPDTTKCLVARNASKHFSDRVASPSNSINHDFGLVYGIEVIDVIATLSEFTIALRAKRAYSTVLSDTYKL
jgi:hypothetical protein